MPSYDEEMDKGLLLLAACLLVGSVSGQIDDKVHKTHAAAGKPNELGCFICDTMEDGERCGQVNQNETQWRSKCRDERRMCMVKRFSYTTSNENSTSDIRMWYLERNCTHRCEPGCIVIGERTKLYACTACCEKPFCNWMSAAAKTLLPLRPLSLAILLVLYSRSWNFLTLFRGIV